ncbi:hypothetical protein TNCV_3933891 [Trichonephila clavipes]|nr:hypothetical protein TNCV_3933891 [Trichonephila clavipes]
MTRLQSVTLQVARGRQNPVDTAYDVGSVVKRLSGRRLLKPTSVSRLLMVSLDGTGCLEGEHQLKYLRNEEEFLIKEDGCGESNSTVPKNSADEKNCADGAKLCTNETEPSASEKKKL